ncbi:hypothetical protein AYO38_10570 [bacterium SCGC AG-212-C10]|nr:hypothetical protein AYO38_10570 [bacterium SCGC AG-212-C10]
MATLPDPDILEWAANLDAILITHDRSTMADFAYERIVAGLRCPGVVIFDEGVAPGAFARAFAQLVEASGDGFLTDNVHWLQV